MMALKKTTQQCGEVKITISFDDQTEGIKSLRLDIGRLTVEDINTSIQILNALLQKGTDNLDE